MDKPKENEVYMLIGGANDKCISNGNTWAESKVNKKNGNYYCLNEGENVCRCGNCEEIPTYLEEK